MIVLINILGFRPEIDLKNYGTYFIAFLCIFFHVYNSAYRVIQLSTNNSDIIYTYMSFKCNCLCTLLDQLEIITHLLNSPTL